MKRILLLVAAAFPLGAQPSVPAWSVSARPTLDIGDDRNVQTQFDGVTGVLRMPGGEIAVANSMSQELRVFSAAGAYLRTLTDGLPGDGMRALNSIWRAGDSIYAAEILPEASSVWVFTLGGFVTRHPVGAANAGGIQPIGRFPDGRLVVSASPRGALDRFGDIVMDSLRIGTLSVARIGSPTWIGWLRNEMVVVQRSRGGRGRGRAPVREPYPYGRSTSYAVSGNRLWIGDSETGTITQHSSSGRGLAVFSAPTPARQLDTAAIRQRRAALLSDAMNWDDRARAEVFQPLPAARKAPRFTRFLPGVDGEMWIALFAEDPTAPPAWLIVARSGAPIGRITLPRRFRPMHVGPAEILGVHTDEEGLEHVVAYSVRRQR